MAAATTKAAGASPEPPPPPIKSVIVIGAGIGGLCVANALRQKGLTVTVLERSKELSRQRGAGSGLSPNGQICLNALGFPQESIMAITTPIQEHILVAGDQVLARSDYPRRLYEKYGVPLTGTLRGDLVDLLAGPLREAKALRLGQAVTNVAQLDDARVAVTLASGKTMEADLVVAADGINSTVAPLLLGDAMDPTPIYSGYSIFFGVIDNFDPPKKPLPLPPPEATRLEEMVDHPAAIVQVLSPHKLFLVAGGKGADKKLVWKLGYKTGAPPKRKEWVEGGKVRAELEAYLTRRQAEGDPTAPVVQSLLARTKDARLLHFGLYSRPHKPFWHKGRVILVGDAAHATLPHVGQGANMAIEDAVVLADCLEQHRFRDVEAALALFYERRRERTRRIVDSSKYVGWLLDAETPWGIWARNHFLRFALRADLYLKFAEKEIISPFWPGGKGGGQEGEGTGTAGR